MTLNQYLQERKAWKGTWLICLVYWVARGFHEPAITSVDVDVCVVVQHGNFGGRWWWVQKGSGGTIKTMVLSCCDLKKGCGPFSCELVWL